MQLHFPEPDGAPPADPSSLAPVPLSNPFSRTPPESSRISRLIAPVTVPGRLTAGWVETDVSQVASRDRCPKRSTSTRGRRSPSGDFSAGIGSPVVTRRRTRDPVVPTSPTRGRESSLLSHFPYPRPNHVPTGASVQVPRSGHQEVLTFGASSWKDGGGLKDRTATLRITYSIDSEGSRRHSMERKQHVATLVFDGVMLLDFPGHSNL